MDTLSPSFQTNLLRVILQDHSFLQNYRSIISVSLFNDHVEKEVVLKVIEFFDKYKSTPSMSSICDYMVADKYDSEEIDEIIKPLFTDKIEDIDFVKDNVCDFVKKNRLKDVILNCNNLLEAGKYETIYEKIKKVVYSDFGTDSGTFFWKDRENVLRSLDVKESYIPTGIHDLDKEMSGGSIRGNLNVVITPPNKGKSTMLINIGKYAAINGFKVVHYTFELSENIINRRYIQSMVRMDKIKLKRKKATAYNRLLEYADKFTNESLLVKEYPAETCTCNDMRRHLNYIKNKHGYIPDIVIVDYADIMASEAKYEQKRFEVQSIYYGLRNISKEFNCAVWTASQTNKGGLTEDIITIKDLDECFKKAAAADVMLSLNQTLDEKRGNPQIGRIFLAKNRDDPSEKTIEIRTDWATAWIGNL